MSSRPNRRNSGSQRKKRLSSELQKSAETQTQQKTRRPLPILPQKTTLLNQDVKGKEKSTSTRAPLQHNIRGLKNRPVPRTRNVEGNKTSRKDEKSSSPPVRPVPRLIPVDNNTVKTRPSPTNRIVPPSQQVNQLATRPVLRRKNAFRAPPSIPLPGRTRFVDTENKVQTSSEFKIAMGKEPSKKKNKSNRYKDIIAALDDYNQEINKQHTEIVETEITNEQFGTRNKTIQDKYETLKKTLEDYATKSKSKKRKKKDNDPRIRAVSDILKTLNKANKDGINEDLNVLRINNLLRKYNPLRNDNAAEGDILGVGAQGEVRSKRYSPTFEAGTKFDNQRANDEAVDAGIPRKKPNEARRAVATYETSRLLGLNVIPPTTFMFGKNPKNGDRQELGQAMLRVRGTDGQRSERIKEFEQAEANKYWKNRDRGGVPPKVEIEWDNDENRARAWQIVIKPVEVPIGKPVIQKELADLQILDNVVGHADRHPGNWRFEGTDGGNITGVKGIDNDDAFGDAWLPRKYNPGQFDHTSKTPTTPPIIDVRTAINILKINPGELSNTLSDKLTTSEKNAAETRLKTVQDVIRNRIKDGDLAIMPNDPISNKEKIILAKEADLEVGNLPAVKVWGKDTFKAHFSLPKQNPDDFERPRNSYLGEMLYFANGVGLIDPKFT